jgi:hypothetical protein
VATSGLPTSCARYRARLPSPAELARGVQETTAYYWNADDMKHALLAYGALVSRFEVYADFVSGYFGGLYERKSTVYVGPLQVQILGYGLDGASGRQYWIVDPSWGAWGENANFEPCHTADVRGPFAGDRLPDVNCADDPRFQDEYEFPCSWYAAKDPGCLVFEDRGQRRACPVTCKRCPRRGHAPRVPCGFARVPLESLRFGAHTFSPFAPSGPSLDREGACADDPLFLDSFERGCGHYATVPEDCDGDADGQRGFCPAACGGCSSCSARELRDLSSAVASAVLMTGAAAYA